MSDTAGCQQFTRCRKHRSSSPPRTQETPHDPGPGPRNGVAEMIDTSFDWMLAPVVWLLLLGGMLLAMEAGRRLHARSLSVSEGASAGLGPVQGAVFGLMGLMVA